MSTLGFDYILPALTSELATHYSLLLANLKLS
jgi:hypothetical protein